MKSSVLRVGLLVAAVGRLKASLPPPNQYLMRSDDYEGIFQAIYTMMRIGPLMRASCLLAAAASLITSTARADVTVFSDQSNPNASTALAAPAPASAQLPSNASIQGAYNFRYLGVNSAPTDAALSYQGTVTFDGKTDSNGNGSFMVTGQGAGAVAGQAANNTYTVFPNGLLQMTNPFDTTGQTWLLGEAGNSAILASSQSAGSTYNDILIAVPAGKRVVGS